MDNYRIRELIEFADQRSRDYSLPNADIAAYRDTAAALWELMQRSQPPVVQQPEARMQLPIEAERDAYENRYSQPLLQSALDALTAAPPSTPVGVAEAWQEGYRQGMLDERTSEANIGIAGFGAKVEPARNNPYALTEEHNVR